LALLGTLACTSGAIAQSGDASKGQPDMEQILQSAPKGKLTVKAVLATGTPKPVPGAQAEIFLFHDDKPFKQLKVLLDEQGAAVVDNLPVVMGVRPLVRIQYAGLTYQESGPPMDASMREASIEVKVFDTTEQMPAWHIPMRHILATPSTSGVTVTELVVVDNPSDRTWLGKEADAKGNRPTVELTLPENAADVTLLSGFHGWCCTSYEGRDLHIKMPLMPGQAQFRFSYTVPFASGTGALVSVAAAAPVDHLMVVLPEDGTALEPRSPEGTEMHTSSAVEGNLKARILQCDEIQAGKSAGVLISGVIHTQGTAGSAAWLDATWVRWGAGMGAAAVVGAGLLAWRAKKGRSPQAAR
jgi:hypothetical protein